MNYAMHPFTGRFLRAETEQAFLRHQLPRTQAQLRLTLGFCAGFYMLFAVTDLLALGWQYDTLILLLTRLVVALAVLLGISQRHHQPG